MDDSVQEIIQLLEAFISSNDEIRIASVQRYQNLEQSNQEAMVKTLFKIINLNISFNCTFQSLIRLRLLLLNLTASEAIISIDLANQIKVFLLNFVKETKEDIFANYSLSSIQDFYFKTNSNEEMWGGFIPYLVELYKTKPLISLSSITAIFDSTQNPELINIIYQFLRLNPSDPLFIQSIMSALILIKRQVEFDGYKNFLSSLPGILAGISDDFIIKPLDALYQAIHENYEFFSEFLSNFFTFFISIISNSQHIETVRIWALTITTNLININYEFRNIVLSNPQVIISALAETISQPHHFFDLYKEGKRSLKNVLVASLNNINLFNDCLKEYGMSENIYVRSVFLRHIASEVSLNFAFENIFSNDYLIRENCFKIIMTCVGYNDDTDEYSLLDEIDERVVDVFIQYLQQQNFEIYKLFKFWCITGKSKHIYKCIDPIISLLSANVWNENLLIMASLLCSCCTDYPAVHQICVNILEYARNCFMENVENENLLVLIQNLLPLIPEEDRINYLNLTLPYIFSSIPLTVSDELIYTIGRMEKDFIPFLPKYVEVLFQCSEKSAIVRLDSTEKDPNITSVKVDYNLAYGYYNADLKIYKSMLQCLGFVITEFPEFCLGNEAIYMKYIEIITEFITFPYDDDIQEEAVNLCNNFIYYSNGKIEIDVISALIGPIIEGAKRSLDFMILSAFSSFAIYLSKYLSIPIYPPYLKDIFFVIFKNLIDGIKGTSEDGKYLDGMDIEFIGQSLDNLLACYEKMFDVDINIVVEMFNFISKIVPYFKMPGLINNVRIFIAGVWVDFFSFAPSEFLPNPAPNLLQDLFEFFNNVSDEDIKTTIIISIGTLVYNYAIQEAPSILSEFNKIASDSNQDIDVRENSVVQFGIILQKCDMNLFNSNIEIFFKMSQIFAFDNEDFAKYFVVLIQVCKYAVDNNFQNKQIINRACNMMAGIIQQCFLDKKEIESLIEEIGNYILFQPFLSFLLQAQKSFEQIDQNDQNES